MAWMICGDAHLFRAALSLHIAQAKGAHLAACNHRGVLKYRERWQCQGIAEEGPPLHRHNMG